ncbi:hypothetical protein AHAS_Ahas15G0157900 [Arachis hypogaea]
MIVRVKFSLCLTYCVVADEFVGRQVSIAFLERVKDDFISNIAFLFCPFVAR